MGGVTRLMGALGAVATLAYACSSTTKTGDKATCDPGAVERCACGEQVGDRICSEDREWGECVCDGGEGGQDPGTGGHGPGGGATTGGATTGGATTGGVGGQGGSPDAGGSGQAGAPNVGGTTSGGTSGTGGASTGGEGGTPGGAAGASAGSGGTAGGEGGAGGSGTTPACVKYVSTTASGAADGSTWANAFAHPNPALAAAAAEATACEVWVAAGVYYARDTSADDTISVPNGAQLYGGFAGTERFREQRDPKRNVTVLSGFDRWVTDHATHVVTVAPGAVPTVIDGFAVTDGRGSGGGLTLSDGVLTLANCAVFDNTVDTRGNGAGVLATRSVLRIVDTLFQGNITNVYPYGTGGGGINVGDAPTAGGATFERCAFIGNEAPGGLGGGIYSNTCDLAVRSSVFVGNDAAEGGAAKFSEDGLFDGVTIVKNHAAIAGGVYGWLASDDAHGLIVWDNTANSATDIMSFITYTFSTVQGATTGGGTGNFNTFPGFAAYPTTPTGAWESVSYQADRRQTTLTDTDMSWTPGAFAGQVLRIGVGLAPQWVQVVDNTATTMTIWGEHASVTAGSEYELFDLRLAVGSTSIDSGHGSFQPALDFYGRARFDAPGVTNLGSGTPAYADRGAFEWRP